MYTIYYKPHSSRTSEREFFDHLWKSFQPARLCTDPFSFAPSCLDNALNREKLLNALRNDTFLAPHKRISCINIIQSGPEHIKIAQEITKISFDIIIVSNNNTSYWEYHENQHRSLNVERPQVIYDAVTDQPVMVPRYVQRLIRDIWRAYYFRPYTIVWKDWFEKHRESYLPHIPNNLTEYSLSGKFSFSRFLSLYIP